MFQKPFRVKTQTSVKSSDRKKLRADIQKQFGTIGDEDVSKLIPNKEEMSQVKINTHANDIVTVYTVGKNPVFFEIFKFLYPTVYTLWQYPDLLQSFRTWPPVFEKLQKGADLMLPGVIPDRRPSPKMFGNLRKGDLVTVKVAGNRAPIALGRTLLSGEDMYMTGLRGKGVGVIHILGDSLWESGDKSNPPDLPEGLPNTESDEGENPEAGDGEENGARPMAAFPGCEENEDTLDISSLQVEAQDDNDEDGDAEEEIEEEEADPIAEMDELLHFCFACAIKAKVKKSDLPLLTGNFLRNFMQPYSCGKQMDLKKSSFKKLSKFLQTKEAEGYIIVKEQSKGVDVIKEVDKSHLGLRDIEVPEITEELEAKAAGGYEEESFTPLTFTDVYCVTALTLDLFKDLGLTKGDAVSIADVRQNVTNYIKANDLQREDNKKLVTLDPILAHIILKPSEGDLDRMNWEQVINRVVGKMQAGVAISSGTGPPIIKRNKLDPIKLSVVMRASQKKVTLVENLEDFGVDVKVFARLIQKSVACSCSVSPSEQKNKGPIVSIQGNQINFVASTLLDKYKIPKRYVVGLENAPKQKKKR